MKKINEHQLTSLQVQVSSMINLIDATINTANACFGQSFLPSEVTQKNIEMVSELQNAIRKCNEFTQILLQIETED